MSESNLGTHFGSPHISRLCDVRIRVNEILQGFLCRHDLSFKDGLYSPNWHPNPFAAYGLIKATEALVYDIPWILKPNDIGDTGTAGVPSAMENHLDMKWTLCLCTGLLGMERAGFLDLPVQKSSLKHRSSLQ